MFLFSLCSPRPSPAPEVNLSLSLEPAPREEVTYTAYSPSPGQNPQQVITILTRVEYKEPSKAPDYRVVVEHKEDEEQEENREKEGGDTRENQQLVQDRVEREEEKEEKLNEEVKPLQEEREQEEEEIKEGEVKGEGIAKGKKQDPEEEDAEIEVAGGKQGNEVTDEEEIKDEEQETVEEQEQNKENESSTPPADAETITKTCPPPINKSVLVVSTIMKEAKYNPNNMPTDIREDEYYYEWVEDILDAFPNKGPPYTPTRLNNTIYIGSLINAEDINHLKRIGITHVLNCAGTRRFDLTKNPYEKDAGIKEYLMIPAEDFEDYDIVRHFSTAFAFLDRCKKQGGKCLVHCNLGVNRSGAVCAGYMMSDERDCLLQVITNLKKARQVVLTNRGFRYQLINFGRMRKLLDPIAVSTGLPITIPPPTGLSKFARDSNTRSMKNKGASDVPPASDFLPAKSTSGAHSARKTGKTSTSSDEMYIPPRPKSACLMEPPVSSRSFTRSSSAMGVYRKPAKSRPYSWSDAEIDEYTNGIDPDDDDYYDSPSSYTSFASYKPKPFSWQRKGSTSTPGSRLIVLNEGLSYAGERKCSSSYGSSGTGRRASAYARSTTMPILDFHSSKISSSPPPRNMIDILKNTRGFTESNGLGTSNGYLGSSGSDVSKPYNTFSLARAGGISFNLPKPPFGTSRRRFAPSKGLALNY